MNSISMVGNLTRDPLVRVGTSGDALANVTVAVTEGPKDNERTHFVDVTAFGTLAENVAASLAKGDRVVVVGRLNTYKKKVVLDGVDKEITMTAFTASSIGPDLRWAQAKPTKVTRAAEPAAAAAAHQPAPAAPAPVAASAPAGGFSDNF